MDYTKPGIWNTTWSRSYLNYQKHHQVFWAKIRNKSFGKVLDLACGPACYWENTDIDLYGCDFSDSAIVEAAKNNPKGHFLVDELPTNYYDGEEFDVVVMSRLINYYQNLTPFMEMVIKALKKGGTILITINVIDDFPSRHWDIDRINKEFKKYGQVEAEFVDRIGWFISLLTNK